MRHIGWVRGERLNILGGHRFYQVIELDEENIRAHAQEW